MITRRFLVSIASVFQRIPAAAILAFGGIISGLITAAGSAWAPLALLVSWYCIGYGVWRGWRRQYSLHRFTKWTPPLAKGEKT